MVLVVLYFIYGAHGTTGKEITTRGPIYYGSGFSYAIRAAQDAQRIDAAGLSRIAGSAA